jgi:uncharacterized protein (TIGR02118 family)
VKTLALIARKPGLSREAFRAHYETTHAPLALPLMSGLLRYVRHHLTEELHGAASFDVATAFSYRDAEAMRAVVGRLATPAGDAVLRDELRFMDKPRNRFFAVREVAETGARDAAAPLALLVLAKRAAAQSAEAFSYDLAARALPELRDAVHNPRWSLQHEALATFGEPPWDAVSQLHADAIGSLAAWCAARESEGTRVLALRVAEYETPLPRGGVP